MKKRKIVINVCFGGFGLSEKAYEKLIEWGVPVRKYIEQKRGDNGLYMPEPLNDGKVIFDRALNDNKDGKEAALDAAMRRLSGRYWDSWIRSENRDHPLLVRVVKELGEEANGRHAKLMIVSIPADVKWVIDEYDGSEHIAEVHRTWP